MKIIHCADLHLDCKGLSRFSPEKRALKRHQMLQNFVHMVDFAEKNKVVAILICGDLFEDRKPLKKSLKTVQDTILSHPNISFFYIWGNHDENFTVFEKFPANFVVFGKKFEKVDFGNLCIGGFSFQRFVDLSVYDTINFQKSDFNVLMAHGPMSSDVYGEPIPLKKLSEKFVDYLALGHIHKKIEGKLDKRGIWAYSGCLEAESFSYDGDDFGFFLIDIENGKMKRDFIPFAKYKYRSVEISVSDLKTMDELLRGIELKTSDFGVFDIVRLIFVGKRKEGEEINVNLISQMYVNKFFYLEILDSTKMIFDLEKYANEKLSLKAEFVKEVLSDKSLTDEEKQQICIVGLESLKGEEISI